MFNALWPLVVQLVYFSRSFTCRLVAYTTLIINISNFLYAKVIKSWIFVSIYWDKFNNILQAEIRIVYLSEISGKNKYMNSTKLKMLQVKKIEGSISENYENLMVSQTQLPKTNNEITVNKISHDYIFLI